MIDFHMTDSGDISFEESKQLASIRLNMQIAKAAIILKQSTSNQVNNKDNNGIKLTFTTEDKKTASEIKTVNDKETIAQMIQLDCKTELGELIHDTSRGSLVYQTLHKRHKAPEYMSALETNIRAIAERYIDTEVNVSVSPSVDDRTAFRFNRYVITIEANGFYQKFYI